ncbi:MAG TPA: MoaD/ThiS family protein [Gammaproteobacteria bacterium]|nr:MoaD/ThiS family protein [Gammaproteobacteria bacterium]
MIDVTARYFAAFREQAGRESERLSTNAATAGELYREVAGRHGFADAAGRCKVAINDELGDFNCALHAGDVVFFFPPVAGG